mgnify:CR=1 FL=1
MKKKFSLIALALLLVMVLATYLVACNPDTPDNGGDTPDAPCVHAYDNACDTTCNLCGDVRTIEHSFASTFTQPTTISAQFVVKRKTKVNTCLTIVATPLAISVVWSEKLNTNTAIHVTPTVMFVVMSEKSNTFSKPIVTKHVSMVAVLQEKLNTYLQMF